VGDKFLFESFKSSLFALFVLKALDNHFVIFFLHPLCNTGLFLHAFVGFVSLFSDLSVSFLASLSPSLGVSTAFFVGLEAFSKFGTDIFGFLDVLRLVVFEVLSSHLDHVNKGFFCLLVQLSSEVLEVVSNTHFATLFMVLLVGVLAVVVVVMAVVLSAMLVAMLLSAMVVVVMGLLIFVVVSLLSAMVVVILSAMVMVLLIAMVVMLLSAMMVLQVAFLLGSGCSGVGSNANGKGGEKGDLGEHDVKL
jgi:hypothetical protein